MSKQHNASRRQFLKSGAVAAAPLAALGAPALAMAADKSAAELAMLQSERAVQSLHRDWMRRAAKGNVEPIGKLVAAVRTASGEEQAEIELDKHNRLAVATQSCVVDTYVETENCTLSQMAHLQGNRLGLREERRTLRAHYDNCPVEGWQLKRVELI